MCILSQIIIFSRRRIILHRKKIYKKYIPNINVYNNYYFIVQKKVNIILSNITT